LKICKRITAALLVLLMTATLSGCTLINVNPDKDNAQVIATMDGQDILKSEFNNYMALTQMSYQSNSQTMPTGSDLTTLKKNIYDSILQQQALYLEGKKENLTVDEAAAKKTADSTIDQEKSSLSDAFDKILSDNYTTEDQFKTWYENYQVESAYATAVLQKYSEKITADPSIVLDETVGKVGDTDVSRGQYYYYYIAQEFSSYMSSGSALATDASTVKTTNETVFSTIAINDANIQYCKDNNIEITDDAVNSQLKTLKTTLGYFFTDDSSLNSYLQSYYMTKTQYDTYQKEEATAEAAKAAIKSNFENNASVSENAIQSYYSKNQDKYDTSVASAMHILTSDEDKAKEIYQEAKDITSKSDFQKLIDKYKDDSSITEATDLGSFDKTSMVSEFSDAVFKANNNTVVGPTKTSYGYHVIFVYDKKDGEVKKLDEVRDEVEKEVKTTQGDEEFDKLETKLQKQYKSDIYDIKTPVQAYAEQLESDFETVKYESRVGV
jgi:foldase protein PrsA